MAIGVVRSATILAVVHVFPDEFDDALIRIVSHEEQPLMKGGDMSGKPFSPAELEQLAKLEAMSDEDIDTSDIPEMTDEQWENARRYVRPVKQPVTIRLDAEVVGWFKEHAGDRPYQTEINRVLRQHVIKAAKRRA